MTMRLQRLISRGLALGLLAAVPLMIYIMIGAPLYDRFTGLRDAIAEQRKTLGRLLAATTPEHQDLGAAAVSEAQIGASIFLPGNSDAMRIAELQSRLGKLAEGEGIDVKSARAIQPQDRQGVHFLGVEVQFSATNERLQKLLMAIHAERPYLVIESIQISPSGFAVQPDTRREPQLDVSLSAGGAVQRVKG